MIGEIVYKRPTPIYISKNLYDLKSKGWKNQVLKVEKIQKEITKGKGAVLCMIDDGIGENEELYTTFIDRWSYLERSQWAGNHSTNGATIVAGATIGIFPEMAFVSKQVLDPKSGTGGSREVISAVYGALENGLETINLSIGSDSSDPKLEKALKDFCANGRNVATIASGNDGTDTDYPAQYAKNIKGVLSIAATQIEENGDINVTAFSSHGVVTLCAPGHVLKTMNMDNKLDLVSGTSFAAPIVGATIAVARTLRPELTQDEILALLANTSDPLNGGPSRVGHGHINIYDFLIAVKNGNIPELPVQKKSFWCRLFGK